MVGCTSATYSSPQPRSKRNRWRHHLISGSSLGGSTSQPNSQCTDSLVPPEQTHWNVNSTSPLVSDTWPTPAQYGQDESLDIELPPRPTRISPMPPELPSPCGTRHRHQATARRPPERRQRVAESAGGVRPSTPGWSV